MDDHDFYPEKPELTEEAPRSNVALTVFSLVLFILVFLLLFEDQVEFIVQLVVVLLIHELGHFLMMKRFGYENVRMLFIPLMGAFVQGKKKSYSEKQSFWVLIAGPFPGILIGSLLIFFSVENTSYQWLVAPAELFLLLNIINLLPIDPLDGGQMFKLLVRKKSDFFLMIFALISSLFLIGIGVYTQIWVIVVFGFFMGFRVRSLQRRHEMHRDIRREDVDYEVTYKSLSNRDFSIIKDVIVSHTPALKKYMTHASEEEINKVMAGQVNGILSTPLDRDASGIFKTLILIFWIAALASPIIFRLVYHLKPFLSEL